MAKLAGAAIERELRAERPGFLAYLVYGPDSGLVQERADGLVRRVVADIGDPFNVAMLGERDIVDDPARLSDELAARSLIGGRRAVRVREAGDRLAAALADRLPGDPEDALLVVEAGELPGRSSLRKLFETADAAAAIACYADEGAALTRVIAASLAEAGLKPTADALSMLSAMLGADRRATRSELAKLAAYAGPGATAVDADDVLAVVSDDSGQAMDAIAFAALSGRAGEAARLYRRSLAEGTSVVAILRSLARVAQRALVAAELVAGGTPPAAAMKVLRPPVFFRDEAAFQAILRRHGTASLRQLLRHLLAAEVRVKSTGYPEEAIGGQTVLSVASRGGRG
ncbi:MAG: DNA polymerase III subunit delta [Alphaproteobacteria bacterium]